MKSKDSVAIEFFCPRALADKLDRMAKDEYSSKAAILRRLIAKADELQRAGA
jgi:Ribbon-helix-helix protein, copG family